MLNPGSFNRRISILPYKAGEKVYDEDGFEIKVPTPQPLMRWAMVRPIQRHEYHGLGANQDKTITTFVLRYQGNTSITTDDKVVYQGRTYEITSILEDYDNRRTLTLFCTEVDFK